MLNYSLERYLLSFLSMFCLILLSYTSEGIPLKATADIWLSNANPQERDSSAGKYTKFKLKSIQEMGAIRFDAAQIKGRQVLGAKLFLRRASSDMLHYIRVSTINQDWVEGNSTKPYDSPDGATWFYADHASKRPWAWQGSEFCDVIMTSGNSLATWAECKKLENGWLSVELTPELIYAMVTEDTDGLAVMDGGNPAFHNNFIYSVQSEGNEPYIEVKLGRPLTAVPSKPIVKVEPAPERAHLSSGAIKVTIEEAKNVFCWKFKLNGKPVERWRISHPSTKGSTTFYLERFSPSTKFNLEVVAVSPTGRHSSSTEVTVTSSPKLSQELSPGKVRKLSGGAPPPVQEEKIRVWAFPGLVKVSPVKQKAMYEDMHDSNRNAVWNGKKIQLFGARGEYVSYQLCIESLDTDPLRSIRVLPKELKGPGKITIGDGEIELFKNWYAKNRDETWQPSYCIPIKSGTPFEIPDPKRKLPKQQNQTVYVDVYIPKDASPEKYTGAVTIEADGVSAFSIPVELTVFDFSLPDRLSFWPELNAYHIPANAHDYYRLAHQHRCVLNCWRWSPKLRGSGKDIEVIWDEYDKNVGPLLSGEAFKNNRRAGVPVRCMYLPFEDSWPTPLTKETYDYQGYWPGRGDDIKYIIKHYMEAPYIEDALSKEYKDAFLSVQKQFIEHFKEKGWNQTEMQCFFGGKNTHRINYGSNMWWTTDEPYHWDDWLAVQFFCGMWNRGREDVNPKQWAMRADISRPQWQGRILKDIVDVVYFGGFDSQLTYHRCRTLARKTNLNLRTYGSANPDNVSNTRTLMWILNVWMNGANAALPWQTLGGQKALDVNDRGAGGGNALFVPGGRFGLKVVADMRLKALRDGQQITEYLTILADRYSLKREQIKAMMNKIVHFKIRKRAGDKPENAEALEINTLNAWQISELRRCLAELIVKK